VSRRQRFCGEWLLNDSFLVRLFLKCKHTAGSGSGGAGNSAKEVNQSQQIAVTLKNILEELKERKEDFEKLKQKVDRLEVRGRCSQMSLAINYSWLTALQATQKELADLSVILESERYRAEVLSTQINDLTELHQVSLCAHARISHN
jgi:predicted RNase H-like nuclease (RuvC/YqgF family)